MPVERSFELPSITLAAQVWGEPGGTPVLASHGWLDNSGTFDLLAPKLPGCELVALDLAGHGRSGFRSVDGSYNLWQDVGDLLDVADALGWERFNLLGHSRGAAISMMFAACFPTRVEKIVLIEGALPATSEADDAPEQLARALVDSRALRDRGGRVFQHRATAIAERAQGFTKISQAAAEVLARRSLLAADGGFRWHADQRLKGASEIRYTPAQAQAFVRRVTMPALVVFAEDSPFAHRPVYRESMQLFPNAEIVEMPGGHHLHMEGAEEAIAERIRRFLDSP